MPRVTSYSELSTWQSCRQKHAFRYRLGLSPKRSARYLSLGSCGHRGLEAFFLGEDPSAAIEAYVAQRIAESDLFDEEVQEWQEVGQQAIRLVSDFLRKNKCASWHPMVVEGLFEFAVPEAPSLVIKGVWDLIFRDARGAFWLCDHKFVGTFRDEDSVLMDLQLGIYQYAAQEILGIPICGIVYNQILTKEPAVPSINQNGKVSRAKIYTNWETYADTVRSVGQDPAEYEEEMRPKLEGMDFDRQYYIYRSPVECARFVEDLRRLAYSFENEVELVYRTVGRHCKQCPFEEPCMEDLKGGDADFLIRANYDRNITWDDRYIEEGAVA